jgi:hypothetical protein
VVDVVGWEGKIGEEVAWLVAGGWWLVKTR